MGALSGGLLGGFARGISDYRNGYSFWSGSNIDEIIVGSAKYEKLANNYNSSKDVKINDRIFAIYYGDQTTGQIITPSYPKVIIYP